MPCRDGDAPSEHFTLEELAEAAERGQHVDQPDENLRGLMCAGSLLGGARPQAATELARQPWIAKFQMRGGQLA